jgi:Lrp/AsnC family transcriptional regulator for asnA, asnC and gidA
VSKPSEGAPLRVAVDMSEQDRALIGVLQEDARATYAALARRLGIAEKTVRRRVAELLANGVIEITTVTDPELLGYEAIALLAIRLDTSRPASEVAAELARVEAIDYVVVTTGRFDLMVELVCVDERELLAAVETSVRPVSGVREVEILPYLRLQYQEPRWETARRKSGPHGVEPTALTLDDVDRRILAELNADGRVPFLRVARTLGVSESQVRQRVARMLESGAVRVLAITNPRSLGFETIAWVAIVASAGVPLEELAGRVAALPSIAYVAICAGRYDVVAEAICVDRADLLRVLDEEVRPLAGVGRTEVFVYLDLHYKRLRPRIDVQTTKSAPRIGD